MKIILSRKGFDSAAGQVASPIFPSCNMISLPIPDLPNTSGPRRLYKEVSTPEGNLGNIVHDLTNGKITGEHHVHLDPDLSREALHRPEGWRPIFGQSGAAETHLQRQSVGEGDLFLFFGWFREVEVVSPAHRVRYKPGAADKHVIFGWLQVDRRLPSNDEDLPKWACQHPHYRRTDHWPDSLYISTPRLLLPGHNSEVPGGGNLRKYDDALCLSDLQASKRSLWRLPAWFLKAGIDPGLTYHSNTGRWAADGDHVTLQSAGRGQEFVLDCEYYPEAIAWAADLLESCYTLDPHLQAGYNEM